MTAGRREAATALTRGPERAATAGRGGRGAPLALDAGPAGTTERRQRLAALGPYLVRAPDTGRTEERYPALGAVAPTAARPAGYPGHAVPWQEPTGQAGRAAGRVERAAGLAAEVGGRVAAVRAEAPGSDVATAAMAATAEGDL
ncbi:hypothetical protein, partial [Marinitenerispora sediminis]|uniref:hypothetical protein n=1 Tax=Marinitenerispora sediminis TaxID=1931232 RepID=UPI000DFFE06B